MSELMTREQIEAEFDSEWILVGDPELTPALEVSRGYVLCHSRNRDDVYGKLRELRPKSSAILFTGKLAPDEAIVL